MSPLNPQWTAVLLHKHTLPHSKQAHRHNMGVENDAPAAVGGTSGPARSMQEPSFAAPEDVLAYYKVKLELRARAPRESKDGSPQWDRPISRSINCDRI